MFELTLCLNIDKQDYLDEFYKEIVNDIKQNNGIIVKQKFFGQYYLGIAVNESKKDYYKSIILDFVTRVIVLEYKYNFFKENIIFGDGLLNESFLKAICLFDKDIDKMLISSEIEFNEKIVIESLFYFKLKPLVLKWQKTASIINHNYVTANESSMIDIVKYLCNSSENEIVLMHIKLEKKRIQLEFLDKCEKFKLDEKGISEALSKIVSLNPSKIDFVRGKSSKNYQNFSDKVYKIFEDKIYFE